MSAHVTWAIERVLGREVTLDFIPQPALEGALRTEYAWNGEPGTGSRLATELRAFPGLRFEVTEDPTPGTDGERYSCTPDLGIFRATIASNGDVMVGEEQIREMLGRSTAALILGEDFDVEGELELLMRGALGRRVGAVPARRRRCARALAQPGRLTTRCTPREQVA